MTPADAVVAVMDQLVSVGFVENPSVAEGQAGTAIDRGFSVAEGRGRRQDEAGRGRAQRSGLRWTELFEVTLTHVLAPHLGQRARVPAYRDLALAYQALTRRGTSLTTEGQVRLGDASRRLLNGGALLEQRFSVAVSFNFDLTLE